jgi:hypothetical protein
VPDDRSTGRNGILRPVLGAIDKKPRSAQPRRAEQVSWLGNRDLSMGVALPQGGTLGRSAAPARGASEQDRLAHDGRTCRGKPRAAAPTCRR